MGQKGMGAAYGEDFDWRFACRPLSLLLIGLLDSPSERMSSIWNSLHVRSPSAGFRDGAGRLRCGMRLLIFDIVRHDGRTLS